MSIKDNLASVRSSLKSRTRLVAVSKQKSKIDILEAYAAGQRIFGENKVQELIQKHKELPKDITWHYVGHLQTNKVKMLVPFVHLIHGVDSYKLLQAIEKEGAKIGRVIPCLLQFHIADEETKFGLSLEEAQDFLSSREFKNMEFISIQGVMGMATNTDDKEKIAEEFKNLKSIFTELKKNFFEGSKIFKEISMGMSNDFDIAIAEGSTLVRVGSKIFGARTLRKKKV